MKFRHIVASCLMATSLSQANAALPMVTANLGSDPVAAPVAGFVMFGSSTSTYTFNLSALSSLSGALFGFGALTLNSVLVDSTPTLLTSGGTFNVAALAAGSHTLTFNYSSPTIGGFGGTVSSAVTPVPEVSSVLMSLLGAGVVGLAVRRKQRA